MDFTHDPKSDLVAVADIGGTQIRTALISRAGKLAATEALASQPEQGFDAAAAKLSASFERIIAGQRIAGMGFASAGPLSPASGTYSYPPSLPTWHGHSFKKTLEANFRIPVVVGHDATMAALAETTFGKYKNAKNLLYLTVSTGIGAGIIANGAPVTGTDGYAGEAGHIIIDTGSPLTCGTECRGCLEALASGKGIVNLAREALPNAKNSSLAAHADALTAELVFDHAASGDAVAAAVIATAIDNLATGIASLLNLFDPDVITLGGGVTDSLAAYWPKLTAAVRAKALPRFREAVPVHITTLGPEVCLLGAAANVFRVLRTA